ncbi:hypothetical protein GCM10027429_27570 [Marivirga atlantica]|jgi:tetratricopeptide (TPR) repeat protein|uniref:Tetratricopeptide repeat protein n=1 Tax=Marivirga atlantica TaxID=1548457 RepID=A0A937AIX7_9BACT|nr:tetratricopeptide repeat protein [Marivirga atlantica]MBL0766359.1 tetratricopeptide repeat protein [Marivirga atlantica]
MIYQFKKVILIFTLILLGCSASEEDLIQAAKRKMDTKAYPEAIEYASQALSENNTNPNTFNLRGVAYFLEKDYSKAIKDFSSAINLDSTNYKPYYNRGNVYLEQKEYEKALFDYNRAISLLPNNADLYINRAIVLYELKQFEEALADNDFAIKLSPENYLPYLNKGKTLVKLGNFKEASDMLTNVVKINDELGEAHYWLGFISINTGKKDIGCDYLIKAKNRGFEQAQEAIDKFCTNSL